MVCPQNGEVVMVSIREASPLSSLSGSEIREVRERSAFAR